MTFENFKHRSVPSTSTGFGLDSAVIKWPSVIQNRRDRKDGRKRESDALVSAGRTTEQFDWRSNSVSTNHLFGASQSKLNNYTVCAMFYDVFILIKRKTTHNGAYGNLEKYGPTPRSCKSLLGHERLLRILNIELPLPHPRVLGWMVLQLSGEQEFTEAVRLEVQKGILCARVYYRCHDLRRRSVDECRWLRLCQFDGHGIAVVGRWPHIDCGCVEGMEVWGVFRAWCTCLNLNEDPKNDFLHAVDPYRLWLCWSVCGCFKNANFGRDKQKVLLVETNAFSQMETSQHSPLASQGARAFTGSEAVHVDLVTKRLKKPTS